jgi:hypothetical protein
MICGMSNSTPRTEGFALSIAASTAPWAPATSMTRSNSAHAKSAAMAGVPAADQPMQMVVLWWWECHPQLDG